MEGQVIARLDDAQVRPREDEARAATNAQARARHATRLGAAGNFAAEPAASRTVDDRCDGAFAKRSLTAAGGPDAAAGRSRLAELNRDAYARLAKPAPLPTTRTAGASRSAGGGGGASQRSGSISRR